MKQPKGKTTFCVKVDAALYKAIHIRAAQNGQSLQGYICGLVEQDMHPKQKPTPAQRNEIKRLAFELKALSRELTDSLTETSTRQGEHPMDEYQLDQTEGMILK